MYYQLPNGKVVNLDISDILDLSDADIQYLISINAGEHVTNPFHGSVIKKAPIIDPDEDDEPIDDVEYHERYHTEYFGHDIIDEDGFDATDLDIDPE
jgi:hypothetical protein